MVPDRGRTNPVDPDERSARRGPSLGETVANALVAALLREENADSDDPEYDPAADSTNEQTEESEQSAGDEDVYDSENSHGHVYRLTYGGRPPHRDRDSMFPKLSNVVTPLTGQLAQETNMGTSGANLRHCCSLDIAKATPVKPAGPSQRSASPDSQQSASMPLINSHYLLLKRETGQGEQLGLSSAQQRHLHCHRRMPKVMRHKVDEMSSRAYIGQYSKDGSHFVAAFQDQRVRVYDVERDWRLRKDVQARASRWTITDTAMSPDQRYLIYSSITSTVHMVNMHSHYDLVNSLANVTEIHDALSFGRPNTGARGWGGRMDSFGIWSVAWSPDASVVIAGTNDNSVYIFDMESQRVTTQLKGHEDDVNAVSFLDDTPHVLVSGSDDHLLRVWDRRSAGGAAATTSERSHATPAGYLVGHVEGLTHIHSREDGRYLISNAKDQTVRLWDLRRMATGAGEAEKLRRMAPQPAQWDYRWMEYPYRGKEVSHPGDLSLMRYRGHVVQQTLIRAYFSPAHTTGQRYIYAGSANGSVTMWDVVGGHVVATLPHGKLVRDCSWHPFTDELATVSWDGRVMLWDSRQDEPIPNCPGVRDDQYDDYY